MGGFHVVFGAKEADSEQAARGGAGGVRELAEALFLEVVSMDVGVGSQAQNAGADAHRFEFFKPLAADVGVAGAEVGEHGQPDRAV